VTVGDVADHFPTGLRRAAHDSLVRAAHSQTLAPQHPTDTEGLTSKAAFTKSLRQTGAVLGLQAARMGAQVAKIYALAFLAPEAGAAEAAEKVGAKAAEKVGVKAAHEAATHAVKETSVKEVAGAVDRPRVLDSVKDTVGKGLVVLSESSLFHGEEWNVAH
jgi:hypothetical protein